MLNVEALAFHFVDLSVKCTSIVCCKGNALNVFKAWDNLDTRWRLQAVSRELFQKRHGAGVTFYFRGEIRKHAMVSAISVDYSNSGAILLDPWHFQIFLTEVNADLNGLSFDEEANISHLLEIAARNQVQSVQIKLKGV